MFFFIYKFNVEIISKHNKWKQTMFKKAQVKINHFFSKGDMIVEYSFFTF